MAAHGPQRQSSDDITARGARSIEVQVRKRLRKPYHSRRHLSDPRGHDDPCQRRGGERAFPTEHRAKPSPEWNHFRITGNDGSISLEVNGKLVTQGIEASPRKGYICLESEGGVVHYRNIRIQELPDTPVGPSDIAIADRGFKSLYNGVDFSGWVTAANSGWTPNDWRLSFAV